MHPLLTLLALLACQRPADDTGGGPPFVAPSPALLAHPDDLALLRARQERAAYAPIRARLETTALAALRDPPDPARWDSSTHAHNGEVAQAAAFLAWLDDDEAMAERAIAALDRIETHWETNGVWDVNIRMPEPLMANADAIDLLRATPWYSEAQAADHTDRLVQITRKLYDTFVRDETRRAAVLGFAQNNHPIRTATGIGYVAMLAPETPEADEWLNWAVSELDYLWGPDGRYVQADGGVSEGPFYFGFAWATSFAFYAALERAVDPARAWLRSCLNRSAVDPWLVTDCVEGEAFTPVNRLHSGDLARAAEWSLALSLPDGSRPPLADAYFNPFNGGAMLTGLGENGAFAWDWTRNVERPFEMGHGFETGPHHLVWYDDTVPAAPPSWASRAFPDNGNVVLRSGWEADARWLLFIAEQGAARKTLHDQVDGLSFSLAAYSEYLLIDSGYYKTGDLQLPETAMAGAHNVLLIDGAGAPDKGRLTDWGDVDAHLGRVQLEGPLRQAAATQVYQQATIERAVYDFDGRLYAVVDSVSTALDAPRTHSFRLHAHVGEQVGGTHSVEGARARFVREHAGLDAWITSTAGPVVFTEPAFEENKAPHVHNFGLHRRVEHHTVLDAEVSAIAPGFVSLLAPWRAGAEDEHGPLSVEAEAPADGVVGWRVAWGDQRGGVLVREAGAPERLVLSDGAVVDTDATSFAWIEQAGGVTVAFNGGTTGSWAAP